MNKTVVAAALFFAGVAEALAGSTNSVAFVALPTSIPTLDDLGLTVLTLVVAIAGGIAVRRRKKK